ncbi:MAG: hypothetical protein JXD22_03365 [Sedimentisphaerales bacterium]|nr:hypothetical protein [Sedimentisphaerales bacterium]
MYITCSNNEDWTSTISYDATDAGVVRAFSMDLTVDGGAKITAISDYDAEGAPAGTTIPVGYSIYMSSIDFGTDPNNVDAWGDPVASGVDALGGLGTAGITVEMGSLYDMDATTPDTPPLTGDLFTITVDADCALTIEDTVQKGTRGGIVLETGSGANLVSSGCDITKEETECYVVGQPRYYDENDNPSTELITAANYAAWVANGKPLCWCCPHHGFGDVNGDGIINTADVPIVWNAVKQSVYLIRADVNHDGVVNTADVPIVWNNVKANLGNLPHTCPDCP